MYVQRGKSIIMFASRKGFGGNKYTFISILMILVIVYAFRLISPQKEAAYPDIIQYGDLRYQYIETVKGSPVMFVKRRPTGKEEYIILARRGKKTTDELYIYEGYLKYRRYVVFKE